MSWFTSYASAPNVTISEEISDERYSARRYTGIGFIKVKRATVVSKKEFRGLTNSAADSAIAYCVSIGASGITKASSGGGSFTVGYTTAVEDSWVVT